MTSAERYLHQLAQRSFLPLWSYPNVYRDQGRRGEHADGKEVADLLVVFENDILIFSDKDVAFPNTGDIQLDWRRWYKRAVLASAKQVWGAERWIREHPDRLYLDAACTRPFPIPLPDPGKARFHRIVVAHDGARRCRDELGGSGSMMLVPSITGDEHLNEQAQPFIIGQVDPKRGFVHVLDDTTLYVLLRKLDTIADFVAYLNKKEQFVLSGRLLMAAGEEELLAHYLTNLNASGEHDFAIPAHVTGVTFGEGAWTEFEHNPQRHAQRRADEISYAWDGLIERFRIHAAQGTQDFTTHPGGGAEAIEPALRLMARESRTARRGLVEASLGMMRTPLRPGGCLTRVVEPAFPGDPYYVFLILPHPAELPYHEYRERRRALLLAYCEATRLRYPDALDVVGIASEPLSRSGGSEDLLYLDTREWDAAKLKDVREMQRKVGLLTQTSTFMAHVEEYPRSASEPVRPPTMKGSQRNAPCPCRSGRKFKKCCGASTGRR